MHFIQKQETRTFLMLTTLIALLLLGLLFIKTRTSSAAGIPPTIVSTIPADMATDQSSTTTITVNFSEAMDTTPGQVVPAMGPCHFGPGGGNCPTPSPVWSNGNKTVTYTNGNGDWHYGSTYNFSLVKAVDQDDGLDLVSPPFTISFTIESDPGSGGSSSGGQRRRMPQKTVGEELTLTDNNFLRFGNTGTDIVKLQQLLNNHGENLDVDGIFGPLTFKAVQDQQALASILVDGIVGPETLSALGS